MRISDFGIGAMPLVTSGQCPLWVKSGHWSAFNRCLLYPQNRTWFSAVVMSALCQERTFYNGLSRVFRCLEDISVTAEKVPPRLSQSLQFGMPRNQIVGRNVLSISYEVSNKLR